MLAILHRLVVTKYRTRKFKNEFTSSKLWYNTKHWLIDDFDVLIGSTHNANRILSNTAVDKLGHEEERRLGWLVPVTSYDFAAL